MLDVHDRKARMNLDKKIRKKLQEAEKNKEKVLKDQLKSLRQKLLAPVEAAQAKVAQELKLENREAIAKIKQTHVQNAQEE